MNKSFIIIIISIFYTCSYCQPDESYKLYDDSQIARIDITVDPAVVEWMYNNVESDSEHYASIHFQNKWINESVDSIGFRLRGNTSRYAQKKSFKISFNTFISGREFYGVDKLNLNGEHNDPSIIRSKLSFELFKDIGMKASRAAHIEVYINGKYYGLYISVEHVDDEFVDKNFTSGSGNLWKCLYPADLMYLGSDPDLYKLVVNGRPVYELTTNEEINDFTQLARMIDILNNTPSALLPDSLEKVLVVPEVLKYFAMNLLVGQWDDYWSNMNNYYLYHDPSEDKFHMIPYDYDNTFGIDWFGINWYAANPYNFPKISAGPRPLAERLFAYQPYRNLYTHFLEFNKENNFKLSLWEDRIDTLKSRITISAVLDSFRTKDYGFTMSDFNLSYSSGAYVNQHVKNGLKEFVNLRYNSIASQLSYLGAPPIVYAIDWSPKIPQAEDSIYITASAFSKAGLNKVAVQYTPAGSTAVEEYLMNFQPLQSNKVEDSDRWVGVIPPIGSGGAGSFRILVKDVNQNVLLFPRHKGINIISPASITSNLVVNEFMAGNTHTVHDSSDEYDDWIEIYNPTPEDVLLSGLYLTDKQDNLTKWQFPGDNIKINAGSFILIWCDEDEGQPGLHANFKLSAGGEFIALTEADGVTIIDSLSFGQQTDDISYGRFPDASTYWQIFNQPTPGTTNNPTAIENDLTLPVSYELSAYPNPFNPTTTIRYSNPFAGYVSLKVYDMLGREVNVLVNEQKQAGTYEYKFNADNLSSGIYFYRIIIKDAVKNTVTFTDTKKLLLMK